jgi:SAM-dependent methyltransferase
MALVAQTGTHRAAFGQPTKQGFETFSPEIPQASRYARWIISTFEPFIGQAVLEVGFGHGTVRAHLPKGVQCVGLDVDPDVVEHASKEDPAATFVLGDVCAPSLRSLLAAWRFDTVLCVNVIEHVADDRSAVLNLLELLPSGGALLLFAPALPALYNDLDRLAGHYRRYRRSDLASLIPSELAHIRRLEYFNPLGAIGWWLNRFARHGSLADAGVGRQVRLFDRYAVPFSRRLNNLTRRWFGQSVLCVAKRR